MNELISSLTRRWAWGGRDHRSGVIVLPQAMRILREYERGVIFRLGKLSAPKGRG